MTTVRAFTNKFFIFWSLANILYSYTILDRISFEKFVKTIKLHLSKDKHISLGTFRKIFLILCFTLVIDKSKLFLYRSKKKSTAIPGILHIRINTRDSFAAAKISTNWSHEVFDEWVNSCFSESVSSCDVRRFSDQVNNICHW